MDIPTQELANEREKEYTKIFKSCSNKFDYENSGFNLTDGGAGVRDNSRWLLFHSKIVVVHDSWDCSRIQVCKSLLFISTKLVALISPAFIAFPKKEKLRYSRIFFLYFPLSFLFITMRLHSRLLIHLFRLIIIKEHNQMNPPTNQPNILPFLCRSIRQRRYTQGFSSLQTTCSTHCTHWIIKTKGPKPH